MQTVIRRVGAAIIMGAALAACGGSSSNNPVTTIAKTSGSSGDAQSATVATALPIQLSVTVTEDGAAMAGATVAWSTVAGSGTVAPTSGVTNASGIATTTWTLGTVAGGQTARATLSGAGGSPVSFTATGTAGVAAALAMTAGDGQSAFPTDAFGTALAVTVADQFGNGIGSATIDWAVQSGPVTLAAATSSTNGSGVATIGATAGASAGPAVVRATFAGLGGALQDFDLAVTAFPTAAGVTAAFTSYTSDRNATRDPAVDTIGVGGTISWSGLGSGSHFVRSTGSPSFTTQTVSAATYQFTFNTIGTYQYDCTIHGSGMTGRVVVR